MPETVYLPKVGMTMEEGVLTRWLVEQGAEVKRGQPLFEMETEKVQMDVEAEADGRLHRAVDEGTTLKPGDVVGYLLGPGEAAPTTGSGAPTTVSSPAPSPSASLPAPLAQRGQGGEARASPIARRIAAEHDIDLSTLRGSGPDGRIVERDVQAAVDARAAAPAAAAAPMSGSSTATEQEARSEALEVAPGGALAYAGRRRTIGERMLHSLQSMAQLTLVSETPVDEAMKMLHGLNREWRPEGVGVTLTMLVAKACAIALRELPRLNARLVDGRIELLPRVNLGVAVDLDEGLMVPVVADADVLPLKSLAQRIAALTERARAGTLTPDDVTGGSFTLTSLQGSVVDAFTPVINPPQAAILGLGRTREAPAFEGQAVVRRQVVTLCLTFDHRLNDGAPAARFLGRVVELLERPYLLM